MEAEELLTEQFPNQGGQTAGNQLFCHKARDNITTSNRMDIINMSQDMTDEKSFYHYRL